MSKPETESDKTDVVTIESRAYLDLVEKLNTVYDYVAVQLQKYREKEDRQWVDSYDVCQYLHISERTLQRRVAEGDITSSKWGGRHYFTIGDIKRAVESKVIKSTKEHLQNLIDNHSSYFHERTDTE